MTKKRKNFLIINLCLVIVIILGVIFYSYPLRWSKSSIRNYVLRSVPIGMSMDSAIEVMEEKWGWDINTWSRMGIEEKRMRVHLGWYYGIPFRRDVCAYFSFDENEKLFDVTIVKYSDSI